jgi:hypothetical protein
VRKKERVKGMNSALLVLITTNCKYSSIRSINSHVNSHKLLIDGEDDVDDASS